MSDEQNAQVATEPAAEVPHQEKPAEKSYTASEVEAIVRKRYAKFADYDELKDKASKLDQLQSEQMSEIEKAQEKAKKEAERAAALEAELGNIKKLNDQRSILVEMGFDPTAVEKLAGRLSGDDADAWKADAENFLPYMGSQSRPHSAADRLDSPKEDPMIAAFKRGAGLDT